MQELHEQELPDWGKPRKVKPVVIGTITNVLSVLFDASERISAEAGKLENNNLALRSDALVDVGLFANSDFGDYVFKNASLDKSLESQIIIP